MAIKGIFTPRRTNVPDLVEVYLATNTRGRTFETGGEQKTRARLRVRMYIRSPGSSVVLIRLAMKCIATLLALVATALAVPAPSSRTVGDKPSGTLTARAAAGSCSGTKTPFT